MTDYYVELGNKIRDLREHNGLTQEEFARLLGNYSASVISYFEKGARHLKAEEISKIAELNKLEIFEYSKLPDSISALIEYSKNIILVNPSHSEVRKRFSIAHEIGHYILGHFEDNSFED